MTMAMAEKQYDLVLFGATGFTGGLTAEYLAANAPEDLRWALVGRNPAKLEAVRSRLAATSPAAPSPDLVEADAADRAALAKVAESTRVVITTVGPYALYGEPLVAACAAAGTDYVDLTGEPEFVDRMWCEHHAEAERTGARLVHCCGFDSIPHDLGAYFTVQQLPEGVPLTVNGYVRCRRQFLRRHLPLGDQWFRPRPPDAGGSERAPPRRAEAGRAQDSLGLSPRRPRPRSRRLDGAAADDRRPDRPPLRRRARSLRPELHLRPPHGRQAAGDGRGAWGWDRHGRRDGAAAADSQAAAEGQIPRRGTRPRRSGPRAGSR